jgi:hypothetical protein
LQDVASEWKQLRYDPPSYLEHLQDIFEGVAVDGTSSYVPGQPEEHDAEEEVFLLILRIQPKTALEHR